MLSNMTACVGSYASESLFLLAQADEVAASNDDYILQMVENFINYI